MTQNLNGSTPKHKPIWIGLTGGIGSGKSTVAGILSTACGFGRVDTDAIARKLTSTAGIAMEQIADTFGSDFVLASGALDRSKIRELVFKNPSIKLQLEQILHPLIQTEAYSQASICVQDRVVLEIPLLAESTHWRRHLHAVWVVDCSKASQISRTQTRSGLTREQVHAIIATQASRTQRLSCADGVFFNEGISVETLEQEIVSFVNNFHMIAL